MKYILLASVLALVTATACQRDELVDRTPARENILNFSVGFAGSGEIVLSKGATLASQDGTVSIPLSCAVTDGIEANLPEAAVAHKSASVTKGTQINSVSEFLNAELTSFTAQGWNADKTEFIPSSTAVSYSDDLWKTADTYLWKGTDSKAFLAYANLPASGATVTNSADPVKQTFTYTVPTNARQQNDIMLGWYEGDGDGTATAAITMVHPLTAVVFKKGDMEGVTAIKSISISGVYVNGTADVTYALSGVDVVPTYNWGTSRTGSQTVTLSPAGEATELEVASDGKIGTSFIIIPQNLASNDVTVTVTFTNGKTASAELVTGSWEAGKTNTYTLSYIESLDIEIQEDFDKVTKESVKVKNTGSNVNTYIRMAVIAIWVDGNGNVTKTCDWQTEGTLTGKNWGDDKKWKKGSDGCFYYVNGVRPESVTEELFSSYAPGTAPYAGTHLDMIVQVQAVEYDSEKQNVTAAWGGGAANLLSTNIE